MPNTLVHLGVQSVSTKALLRGSDFKWIALGCVIPDFPWIIQRVVYVLNDGIVPDSFRLYCIVQSSLMLCLILSAMISMLASNSGKIFLILAFNSLFHLLLDAMQIKWANGVHLAAPFSWKLTSFALVWPEHVITYVLTAAGFAALVYFGVKDQGREVRLASRRPRYLAAAVLLALYLVLPWQLRFGPDRADSHYLATLRSIEERPGKYLELDRSRYRSSDSTVELFSGERLKVTGKQPRRDTLLSVQGHFVDRDTLRIAAYHVHSPARDASSIIGLAGVLVLWLAALVKRKIIFEEHAG